MVHWIRPGGIIRKEVHIFISEFAAEMLRQPIVQASRKGCPGTKLFSRKRPTAISVSGPELPWDFLNLSVSETLELMMYGLAVPPVTLRICGETD